MEETKLSDKERQLLEPFYETDLYQLALKPIMERMGNGYSRLSAENAPDWDTVMRNRGKLEFIKELHRFVKSTNIKGKSKVKSK